MPGRFSRRNPAMTIVELLVVLVILAVLTGLLAVAISHGRVAARRTQCMSNLRQLSTAMRMYVEARKDFPAPGTPDSAGGWVVALMPFIEEQPTAEALAQQPSLQPGGVSPLALKRLALMTCPTVDDGELGPRVIPPAHYALLAHRTGRGYKLHMHWEFFDVPPATGKVPWVTSPELTGFPSGIGPHDDQFNVLAMGLNPSPSGETFRFFDLLEFGDGEVPNEFAQPL